MFIATSSGTAHLRGEHSLSELSFRIVRINRGTYLAVLVGALVWCSIIFCAPLSCAAAGELTGFGGAIYRALHLVCHQIPERTLHILDWPLAVCVRCAAIYIGFFCGILLYPAFRSVDHPVVPPRALLIAAAIPLLIDGLSIGFLLYDVTNLSRGITGAVFGILVPFTVIPAAQEAATELFGTARQIPNQKGLSDA